MEEAQLIETLAINQVGFPSLIASKAARIVSAAQGRRVIDFGGRRAHGIDAAVTGARAAYIGGADATANVYAGRRYGVPITGTMAHSFIQSFDDEMDAFRSFARVYPSTVLLVDTYDPIAGVKKVVALAKELGDAFKVRGVRIDSGDLTALSKAARRILDEAGLPQVQIVASGGLDEYVILDLVAAGAPIDVFGVGTDLAVSGDAPALDIVYKLTEFGGEGRVKLSVGKRSLPGRKQIFRNYEHDVAVGDVIARAERRFRHSVASCGDARRRSHHTARISYGDPRPMPRRACKDAREHPSHGKDITLLLGDHQPGARRTRPKRPRRDRQSGRSGERLNIGDRAPGCRAHVVRGFVGVHRLQILCVPHHMEFFLDAVRAVHVAGCARDI